MAQSLNAIGENYLRKRRTIGECLLSDKLQTLTEIDGKEGGVIVEDVFVYHLNAVGDRDAADSGTGKRTVGYRGHASVRGDD